MKKNIFKMSAKNGKGFVAFMLSMICVTFTACNSQQSESDSVIDESIPDVTATTTIITESISTQPTSEVSTNDDFAVNEVVLPDTLDTVCKYKVVEGFDYNAIMQDLFTENFDIVALYQDKIVIQKATYRNNSDDAMLEYYKYDLKNDVLTKLDGNIPNSCFKPGNFSVVDNKMELVCENSSNERIFYTVDLVNNSVNVKKTEIADPTVEGFYYNYTFDEDSYMQLWFEIGTDSTRYANISRCSKDSSKEIVTHKKADTYAFANHKIYELTTDIQKNAKCVNILNEDGDLESTIYLPEVDDALKKIDAEYLSITGFNVIGNNILINIRDEYQCTEMSFVYNIKHKTLNPIPNCRFLSPIQAINYDMQTMYFYSISQSLEDTHKLYRLDESGNISLIAENLSSLCSYATDGQNIAYFHNSQLCLVYSD